MRPVEYSKISFKVFCDAYFVLNQLKHPGQMSRHHNNGSVTTLRF